jgi:hypothetical protein
MTKAGSRVLVPQLIAVSKMSYSKHAAMVSESNDL